MTDAARLSTVPVLGRIPGQARAVRVLEGSLAAPVHAYLFVGPVGSGKRDAAMAFAAALVCPDGGCGRCASCRAVLTGSHPDVVSIERSGASVLLEDVRDVTALAHRTPTAGERQVIVLNDFQLAQLSAPALLKTIEEPPPSTVFLVVADGRASSLATIASRCVLVEFVALTEPEITAALLVDGVDPTTAAAAAAGAHGRLDRARLLVRDPDFAERQQRWQRVPETLDGTGATAARLASELLAGGEALVAVVKARQAEELEALVEMAERNGTRLTGRQGIDAQHAREQRRVRTDELRAGLATLADAYRSRLEASTGTRRRPTDATRALLGIDAMAASLVRNPTESLQLLRLLVTIDESSAP